MIVLDTNVVSEMLRPRPNAAVTQWLRSQPTESAFTTTITQAEILYGVTLLPNGRRRNALLKAVELIFDDDMAGRILPFDEGAARHYAEIAAQRRRGGQPISAFDAQIAAIVRSRGAGLATRNIRDFHDCGIALIDPWTL